MKTLDAFTSAYITAMLWSSTDDDGEPLDANYSPEDLAPEAWEKIKGDCAAFLADDSIAEIVERLGVDQCGHDFWLTRNHHGAGFWDHGYSDEDEAALMERARKFRELAPTVAMME